MSKKVSYARLHQGIFVKGHGLNNVGDVLDPTKQTGIEMELNELGLQVTLKGVKFVVPMANVSVAVLSS